MKTALRLALYVLGGLLILAGIVGSFWEGDTSKNITVPGGTSRPILSVIGLFMILVASLLRPGNDSTKDE